MKATKQTNFTSGLILWNPVDFVSFNGLALNRDVESITFIEVKSGRSTLSGVERSIREAVEKGKISFETATHLGLTTFKPAEMVR